VAAILGVSPGTVKNMERDGRIPRATRFGPRAIRKWPLETIQAIVPQPEPQGDGDNRFRPARIAAGTQ